MFKHNVTNGDRISELLWNAFPNRSETKLTHAEAVTLRGELCVLDPEDFRYWLPEILDDILAEHRNDESLENIQWVLGALDVSPNDNYEWEQKKFGVRAARYSHASRNEIKGWRQEAVREFSLNEARAVYEWLVEAQSRPKLRTWDTEIQSAIEY